MVGHEVLLTGEENGHASPLGGRGDGSFVGCSLWLDHRCGEDDVAGGLCHIVISVFPLLLVLRGKAF